jgi:predicted nucleic acid-binding protein
MKLVIDTNILISALIKDSATRELLLLPSLEFFLPEYALQEIEAHKAQISRRSGLSESEIDVVLSILLENVGIVPASNIKPYLKKADKIIGRVDPSDTPFVALALSIKNDGIWSNDRHFEKIKGIKVWKTSDLLKLMQRKHE